MKGTPSLGCPGEGDCEPGASPSLEVTVGVPFSTDVRQRDLGRGSCLGVGENIPGKKMDVLEAATGNRKQICATSCPGPWECGRVSSLPLGKRRVAVAGGWSSWEQGL